MAIICFLISWSSILLRLMKILIRWVVPKPVMVSKESIGKKNRLGFVRMV